MIPRGLGRILRVVAFSFLNFIFGIFVYSQVFAPSSQENERISYSPQIAENNLLDQLFPLTGSFTPPKPGFTWGKVGNNAKMIIGITTVKRNEYDYLLDTIDSLIRNRRSEEGDIGIVVFIGETNQTYVINRSKQIQAKYAKEMDAKELQVISPPEDYYPDWGNAITTNLNDPIERVKWRSKQNLDQLFLMTHIFHLSPSYYLMMEDDVISKPGYDGTILRVANSKKHLDWFHISFCNLGAIGKLYRNSILPTFATFIRMFWNKKPLDWLQVDYVRTALCGYEDTEKVCRAKMVSSMLAFSPSLFQHVGKFSSLKGKVQDLQDSTFTKANKPQIN